ncbi:MAG: D-2-hydroxyacid dehydrogenase [Rhodospirillaceae bacterium]|jgi:phosphoglycerate dehydrogenase-like enzyme|nr:D-2-hydroxyacid dehydrogenase [Rhodospirillaceae bacterium]MBT6138189.1 D-2-hydroxyacid dehydrogenase [Rhodospirillaceae bacterium]
MPAPERIRLHIKNNRDGEELFRTTPERYRAAEARYPEIAKRVDVTIDWDLDNFETSISQAHALLTWELPTENLAARAPELRLIHTIGAGIEHLQPVDAWLPAAATLTNNRGVHAEKTGESAAMALLMLNNNMPKYATDQRAHRWDPQFAPTVAGKTVTLLGVGEMGGAAAEWFKRFGLRVLGVRRSGEAHPHADKIYPTAQILEAVAEADFVHVTLPSTKETNGMIDASVLDAMKPGAGIVNFGRAAVIDHAALFDRLRSGHIGGAILDVHDPEPLPADAEVWDVPNLLVVPHVTSDDVETYADLTLDLVFENIGRWIDGKAFRNRVDPVLGY